MKRLVVKWTVAVLALFVPSISVLAAQTKQTVSQVTSEVTLTGGVDYIVTSSTPFGTSGLVNIADTEHSVLIFTNVVPSRAASMLSRVRIDGRAAVNNVNCMVRMYAGGSIILPYSSDIKPLTVYTGKGCTGETARYAVGGRVSLRGDAMNNSIRSFTLKRGYMVCFMTRSDGTGYSRVFIADSEDRTVDLPAILSGTVSALRVQQWNDSGKKGYAGNAVDANTALNTTWCYNWDAGVNVWADREYVTQHHHEGWPGISDVGNNGTSACILGNNEPDNVNDDREQVNTVEEVLATWPQMMATGRRLGSPAMSSDLNWLYRFIDSIDARGWRCDFVVMHCYWYSDWSSWFNTLRTVHNRTKRPIWITEMNYGANWTGWPGSDRTGSDANFAIGKQHFAPVVDGLEATDWLERYAVYNWVEDCRSVYLNGKLTPMGEYYAAKETGIAYNPTYEVVPTMPKCYDPDNLVAVYNKTDATTTLTWHDYNGEYNRSMLVERRVSSSQWETVAEITPKEEGADYEYTDTTSPYGTVFRIHIVDASGRGRYTGEAASAITDVEPGDALTADGRTFYVGGNIFVNGDFNLGLSHWTDAAGNALAAPWFEAVPRGGIDGGSYLQAWGNGDNTAPQSLRSVVDVKPDTYYYCSVAGRGVSGTVRLSLSSNGTRETERLVSLSNTSDWAVQSSITNSMIYKYCIVNMRDLAATAQIDRMMLCELFTTREAALADALEKARVHAEAFKAFNTRHAAMNAWLDARMAGPECTAADIADAIATVQTAIVAVDSVRLLYAHSSPLFSEGLMTDDAGGGLTWAERIDALDSEPDLAVSTLALFRTMRDEACPVTILDDAVKAPAFSGSTAGWNLAAGTYRGGRQQAATVAGRTCWSALWTNVTAEEGAGTTLAVNQTLKGLSHGYYQLECKASTQHYCITDQHAFLTADNVTAVSPSMTIALQDIPSVADVDKWETLVTSPVYIADGAGVTIGFESSKAGATDGQWMAYANTTNTGDNREGWWCATDFCLRFIPFYKRTLVEGEQWGTICLPYAFTTDSETTLYQIAGVTADLKSVCLAPVDETIAGMPYVFRTTLSEMRFRETGKAVATAVTTDQNFRGNFVAVSKAPVNSYVLYGNEWHRINTTDDRVPLTDFGGMLRNASKLTVIDDWQGDTMPINDLERDITAIDAVNADAATGTSRLYDVSGRRAFDGHTPGVTIRVAGDKVTKVIGGKLKK